jgi:periplasmic protein TonB
MNKFIITLSFILVVTAHLILINFLKTDKTEQNQQQTSTFISLQLSKIQTKKEVLNQEVVTQKEITKPKNETNTIKQIEKTVQVKKEVTKPSITALVSKEQTKENSEKNITQEVKEVENTNTKNQNEIKENLITQDQINKEKLFIQNYMFQLRQEINKNKSYPVISRKLKEEGKVIVSFRVQKNGLFENIKLKSSCSIKRLDDAALNALYETKSYKAFDKDINKEYMDFDVPLEFVVIN